MRFFVIDGSNSIICQQNHAIVVVIIVFEAEDSSARRNFRLFNVPKLTSMVSRAVKHTL